MCIFIIVLHRVRERTMRNDMRINMQKIEEPRMSDIEHGALKHCHVIIIGRRFHAFDLFIPSCFHVYFSFGFV